MNNIKQYLCLFYLIVLIQCNNDAEYCAKDGTCFENYNKYSKEINYWEMDLMKVVELAVTKYNPCIKANCSCHKEVIYKDLQPFHDGITKDMFNIAVAKGTKYQIIDGKLFRAKECHFPARCNGIEHYLKILASQLPNMELAINTRDWPQLNQAWGHRKAPVFSFNKRLL